MQADASAAAASTQTCQITLLPTQSADPGYDGLDPDDISARILFDWIFANDFESGEATAWGSASP